MPSLRKAAVWITVNGKRLKEYGREQEGKNEVNVFIASEVGQNTLSTDMAFFIYADGQMVGKIFCEASCRKVISDTWTSQSTKRRFMFSDLELTDDEATVDSNSMACEGLGLLDVQAFRVAEPERQPESSTLLNDSFTTNPVHERSIKAVSHRVTLGRIVQYPSMPVNKAVKIKYIDPVDGEPYVRFCFMYRPRDLLQAQGIIPPPEPSRLVPNKKRQLSTPYPDRSPQSKISRISKPESEDFQVLAEAAELLAKKERLRALQQEIEASEARLRLRNEAGEID